MHSQQGNWSRIGQVRQTPMPDQVVLGHLLPHYHAAQEWQDTVCRMRDAGSVADDHRAAQERRARVTRTGRSATSGTSMTALSTTACRGWIGTRLIAVGRWLAGASPSPTFVDDRFMTSQRRPVS